ncbi:MAG: transcription-repair coupling factor [Treponema sp.]|jgi:transcription-repair coupling factor (superfamily II helicase)|nr:transcription-repair coupling factor [Treponema sp.]
MNNNPNNPIMDAVRRDPAVAVFLEQLKYSNNRSPENLFPLEIEGPEEAARAIILSLIRTEFEKTPILAVVPTEREAEDLAGDVKTILSRSGLAIYDGQSLQILPWWGTLPYRDGSPLSTVFGERTGVLTKLINGSPLIIVPERAFLTPLPPPDYFRRLLITLKTGDTVDTTALASALTDRGYTRVPRVQLQGEFTLRGEVLDILMGPGEEAYRIVLDFDRVESIKCFDPLDSSQSSVKVKLSSIIIRPQKEVIWNNDTLSVLQKNLMELPEFIRCKPEGIVKLLESLKHLGTLSGEELLFPLAFGNMHTILDYLPPESMVFFIDRERMVNAQESLETEYRSLFREAQRAAERASRQAAERSEQEKPVPAPERIFLSFNRMSLLSEERFRCFSFMAIRNEGKNRIRIPCDPPRSFFGNLNYLREEFTSLTAQGWTITVAAESEVQAERIKQLLELKNEKSPRPQMMVINYPLSSGFSFPGIKLMVVQENEIFGRRRRIPRSLNRVKSSPIDTFVELNPGDYVVHINYGIGHFKGIERIHVLGHERDYVKIEYQDDEAVLVPIEQVNLVQRYIGSDGDAPRLDKLGSRSWESRKSRVKKAVEDIADELILLYSKRKAAPGFAFSKDSEWQLLFEASFPFDETEDQLRCVDEIKTDMESPHPMDRLVCGDVGYGKTEVAVRACFKAVMGGKQAAFLAPTTILAEQHYDNFQERFSQFPVKIAMLSRFVKPAAAKRSLAALVKGEIDILVGTHRIIQKDVVFKNLGLLVVDEEQRFGVKDKERLKELKTNVDCLTLSATPIPRTLHMSLLKIRDMSLLATPPQNRRPIETIIGEYDDEKIAGAIRAEVERGGQVFFLHNRIGTLKETRIKLEQLVPEMTIETAHGQMESSELEDVMRRFVHGGFHVLLSTTIIENGIDIPNVNTIIIDRADMYGISQLYQLRGRVGRSDRIAYAYLYYPRNRALSEIAIKRLQVISDFTELGSGFKIAMKDMEIRGAGNLLGREQSGDIYSVGFDLYLKLLDEAVQKLTNENYEAETETLLELEYSGFIPEKYIDGQQEKMEIYKKIAAVKTREDLDSLHAEMTDRFGTPPDEAASLLSLAEIRIICRDLAVSSLKEKSGMVKVSFARVSKIHVDRLLRLIKESAGRVKLDPKEPNVILLKTGTIGLKEKSEFIREKLQAIAG